MSWADCGKDSTGRRIGYGIAAECDHPGCTEKIDRGLAYVCGVMHGSDEYSCERYFCGAHRANIIEIIQRASIAICDECYSFLTLDCHERIEGHKDFGIEDRT